jgi:hypothetical protein
MVEKVWMGDWEKPLCPSGIFPAFRGEKKCKMQNVKFKTRNIAFLTILKVTNFIAVFISKWKL